MEAVIFCGIQGSGKSTFYRERFFETHVRINLDMLRTRNREDILLHACLAAQQPVVIDNTNPMAKARRRYVDLARAAGFTSELYYFPTDLEAALQQNAQRAGRARVPDLAVRGTARKLEIPSRQEGYERMYRVQIEAGRFVVEDWRDEV